MPAHETTGASARTSAWEMLRTMGGIGLICALLIVLTYQWTLPTIEAKKAAYLSRAVYAVLPGAVSQRAFVLTASGALQPAGGGEKGTFVYAGYDSSGRFVGVAIEASGQGFQDALRLIYGYAPELQAIVGFRVLESKETPGLGDKIEKDGAFLQNFVALDVSLAPDGTIRNPIVTVKHGTKTQALGNRWRFTGATISSKAVGRILRESSLQMVPRLQQQLGVLTNRQE